jgi:TRAP-type C4-dicarboxylate transport system permease small subunit
MLGRIVSRLEEGAIALLLAAMALVTFSQVVARYVFNTGAVWALELTQYLFAWLVLFGMSYSEEPVSRPSCYAWATGQFSPSAAGTW